MENIIKHVNVFNSLDLCTILIVRMLYKYLLSSRQPAIFNIPYCDIRLQVIILYSASWVSAFWTTPPFRVFFSSSSLLIFIAYFPINFFTGATELEETLGHAIVCPEYALLFCQCGNFAFQYCHRTLQVFCLNSKLRA